MTGEAVVGPLTGARLAWIPTEVTTWGEWRAKHPETTVLKPPNPKQEYEEIGRYYARYRSRDDYLFPLPGAKPAPKTYRNKDRVTIVVRDGKARCYPHPALPEGETVDGGLRVLRKGATVVVRDAEGREVPSMTGYWFSFFAFYPDGTVWRKQE